MNQQEAQKVAAFKRVLEGAKAQASDQGVPDSLLREALETELGKVV